MVWAVSSERDGTVPLQSPALRLHWPLEVKDGWGSMSQSEAFELLEGTVPRWLGPFRCPVAMLAFLHI